MDINKEAIPLLAKLDVDWLLIDFIDERNPVLNLGESTASLSVGLESLLKGSYGSARLIRNNTPEFKDLWICGWTKFIELMRSTGMANRCVLHKVWFAEKDSEGVYFDTATVEKGNAYLDFFYKHATESLPEMLVIEVPKTLLVGDAGHKWGRAPFHYVKEQHKYLLDHL